MTDPAEALVEAARDLIDSGGERMWNTETLMGKSWPSICVNPAAFDALKDALAALDADRRKRNP